MPFLDSIVGLINDGITEKLSASKVTLSIKGISKQLPRTDADNTQIPAYVDNFGHGTFSAIDDRYSVSIYHKCEGLTYQTEESLEFGDGQTFSRETAQMALLCFGDRTRLQMTQEWLASVVAAGFPYGVTKSFKQTHTGLNAVAITITNVENDSQTVWAREFVNIAYALVPESILFQLNYTIETVYNKSCIELCEECPPVNDEVHCTPVCEYTVTVFLSADGQIATITKCNTQEEIPVGGLRLSSLESDSVPLKNVLVAAGCNEDIVVSVARQPATFFFDISITMACRNICCLDQILGSEDGGPDWSTSFTQTNCEDYNA